MKPYLWIAYDYVSVLDCLQMLDTIVSEYPDKNIIHEIGRPTIIHAARLGIPVVTEFRKRLTNGQILVADFKGYDVPYIAEGKYYYAEGTDLVTVMAMAPNEAVQDAIDGAIADKKMVAFDLMSYLDNDVKLKRTKELVEMGAKLISCHTGWSEQAAGKTPNALLEKVYQELKDTDTKIVVMGGLKPENIKSLSKYIESKKLFAIVSGSAITRSPAPNAVIAQFLEELSKFNGQYASLATVFH
ncbi:MAG: orotidine 5'-phosphate decarboxylase [Chroococcidiopsidaceae cyanobacterium CP_BM_RX_35]|nr:orotidine 5'-phosphate decarboxylase [Chroococcidiopsidaceae cyanobacterium CP_BM_RX_35]